MNRNRIVHSTVFHLCQYAFLAAVWLFGGSARADVFCRWERLPQSATAAPNGWLAPAALHLASPDGERLAEIRFAVSGIPEDAVAEVALFRTAGQRFPQLAHFPEDGLRLPGAWRREDGGVFRFIPEENIPLPVSMGEQTEFLFAIRLSGNATDARVTLDVQALVFERSGTVPLSLRTEAEMDVTPPQAEVTVDPAQWGQLSGWRIRVTASEPLAFPPLLRPLWTAPVKDWHAWRKEPGWGSAFSLTPLSDTLADTTDVSVAPQYELFLPHQRLLSGNLTDDKPLRYELSPPPDNWKWRKDEGNELVDGDARSGALVLPGGCQWLKCDSAMIGIDMGMPTTVAGVVLYLDPATFTGGEVWGGNDPQTMTCLGTMLPVDRPISRFAYERAIRLIRAAAFFPEAPSLRYLSVRLQFEHSLTVTEMEVWGAQAEAPDEPEGLLLELTDTAGNRALLRR